MLNYDKICHSLSENSFVSQIYYYEEADSTNNIVKRFEGNSDILVCADFQKEGRGRFERKWESVKGRNLTFSIGKTIPISASMNQFVNFFFSYFLYNAVKNILIESDFGLQAKDINIKWPNDLMHGNRKIAGLLIESLPYSSRYVIGIGLNVNQDKFAPLENVTSLKDMTGAEFDLDDILISVVDNFSSSYELLKSQNYPVIFEKWLNSTSMLGRSCEFTDPTGLVKQGIINDLSQDGSIEISIDDKKKRFYSGDIKLRRI